MGDDFENYGSDWNTPDFAGTPATDTEAVTSDNVGLHGFHGGFTGIAPPTSMDAEAWRSLDQNTNKKQNDSSSNDIASYIRDTALAAGTAIFKSGTQALTAKIARAVGPGSNPIQQGPSGRTINIGGVPVTLTATQAANLTAGKHFNLTRNQRNFLSSQGVTAPKNIFSAITGNAAADAGGSPNTLYFVIAGGVLLLLFFAKK